VGKWEIGKLPLDRASNFSATITATPDIIELIRYQQTSIFAEFSVLQLSLT
jgi:hypothetical protein